MKYLKQLMYLRQGIALCSILRPWREKVSEGQMRGYQIGKHYRQPLTWHYVPSSPARGEVNGTREKGALMRGYSSGFTLMEMLVVVLIIGILGAIALPQYQRAVLKSRFAALMPIAKSMADSNEAFYLEHGEYADNAEDLPVQGRMNYQDGTELEFGTTTSHAYVLATRDNNFPNNYIVYQKHSEQFPGEIHCEAAVDNTLAQDVCKSFGATDDIGETLTPNYLTYVLFGTGNGVAPSGDNTGNDEPETPTCPDNSVCDEDGNVTGCNTGYKLSEDTCVEIPPCQGVSCDDNGNITECASGLTLNNGECVTCDIPNATSCSTTSYAPTACSDGYVLNGTACITQTAALQAVAAEQCPTNQTRYVCTIKNGTVSRCDTNSGTRKNGECVSNGTNTGYYEIVYGADGKKVQALYCGNGPTQANQNTPCGSRSILTYHPDGSFDTKLVSCENGTVTKDFVCPAGKYFQVMFASYDSHNNPSTTYNCNTNTVANGNCSTYKNMQIRSKEYDNNGTLRYYLTNYCPGSSIVSKTCTNNNYKSQSVTVYNESGQTIGSLGCKNGLVNQDYSCAKGWEQTVYDSNGTQTGKKDCTSYDTIDWTNATCN